ncbi:MAG: YkgJ family cysteine cluster protein [Longimicrobiales bacterium]
MPVTLRGLRQALTIPSTKVHFAFADGRFAYDCGRCGAQCCRGHGYGLNNEETLFQLQLRPHIRFFVEGDRSPRLNQVKNCAPSCFFLSTEGSCEIHSTLGYEAKPETCRLFPFNGLFLVDDYLVVSPHPGLCPLEVERPPAKSAASSHEILLRALSLKAIDTQIHSFKPLLGNADSALQLEKAILALSESCLMRGGEDWLGFVDEQRALTRRFLERDRAGVGSKSQESPLTAREALYHMAQALGIPVSDVQALDEDVFSTIVAMTPSLRSQLVFINEISSPNRMERERMLLRIPLILHALAVIAQLAKRAGMKEVSYQTVARLFREHLALLKLLALLDVVVTWDPSVRFQILLNQNNQRFQRDYIGVGKALLWRRQRRERQPLLTIVRQFNDREGLDRITFLRLLSRQLPDRTRSVDDLRMKWTAERVKVELWRCIIELCSDDLLVNMCQRVNAHRTRPTGLPFGPAGQATTWADTGSPAT